MQFHDYDKEPAKHVSEEEHFQSYLPVMSPRERREYLLKRRIREVTLAI